MKIKNGFLYFDDNKKLTPDYKILYFSRLFFEKFKIQPTICKVNPATFSDVIGGDNNSEFVKFVNYVRVEQDKTVQTNHFHIGEIDD